MSSAVISARAATLCGMENYARGMIALAGRAVGCGGGVGPAPGNPNFGKTGAATIPLIDPPRDTEAAKTAKVVSTYTFTEPNLTPAETWAGGFRTPYGLAFSPTGEFVGGGRAEPDREGQELWLAAGLVWQQL